MTPVRASQELYDKVGGSRGGYPKLPNNYPKIKYKQYNKKTSPIIYSNDQEIFQKADYAHTLGQMP